jgi:DNA polymerase-3 subunit epsilon
MHTNAVACPAQVSFDELDEPLRAVTFVVVDLETTGGSAADCNITEIGAVKVRGGEIVGEFATLVDPGCGVPPYITVLTGITDAMLVGAPTIASVLPSFFEFARGAVLVAHNAPFDLGFLRAAANATGHPWPGFRSVDTAVLARRVLTRDEVPNCKLATLAGYFNARTTPTHRALDDARATVDVLHALFERVGSLGVQSFEELHGFTRQVSDAQRRKRHLADGLPTGPGVYLFRGPADEALYIGKSRNIRARVRNYFVSSERRTRMAEMVGLATRVDSIACAHALEADVRELRLIAEHKPRYNRRSRFPERSCWLKLTVEPFPRLSIVRTVRDDGAPYLGPFGSKQSAEQAMTAIFEALPLRQCGGRLPTKPSRSACALAEMGRCGAPCEGREAVAQYAEHTAVFRAAIAGDARPLLTPLIERIATLSAQQRYEDAGAARDRLTSLARACARLQRITALTRIPEVVAARPRDDRGWDLALIRHGRLAAAATAPPRASPWPYIDAMGATAETTLLGPGPLPASTAEETECVLRWLEQPGTRLVRAEAPWACPAHGAGQFSAWLARIDAGRAAARPLADRRALHPIAQPARASA